MGAGAAVGKTVVSSSMIDRVAAKLNRRLYEAPVGFKWFVDGLARRARSVFAVRKARGPHSCAVMAAPGRPIRMESSRHCCPRRSRPAPPRIRARYTRDSSSELGKSFYARVDAAATPAEKRDSVQLVAQQIQLAELVGEKIQTVLTRAPGNEVPIGGVKVVAKNGWFAARPSGTENIYKIYAESFRGTDHLRLILEQAQTIVEDALVVTSDVAAARP